MLPQNHTTSNGPSHALQTVNKQHIESRNSGSSQHNNGNSSGKGQSRDPWIKHIVMHHRPHLDELAAVWLLRTAGQRFFRGVAEAKLVFLDKELKGFYPDDIYVGLGGGPFDEHRPEGRLPNTSAALLVAEHVRVSHRLSHILSEIVWCDTHQKVSPTQLASLVKMAHRVKQGKDQDKTYAWCEDALGAIAFGQLDQSFDIRTAWADFIVANEIPSGSPEIAAQHKMIDGSYAMWKSSLDQNRQGRVHVTELSQIAARMEPKLRERWLTATFWLMVRDGQMYAATMKELMKKSKSFDVQLARGDEPAAFIQSSSEHMLKCASSEMGGKMAVIVIRNSIGQVTITSGVDRNMPLGDLARMLRMLEVKIRTGRRLSWANAEGRGTLQCCDQWCLAFDTLLLNGSLSHPHVEPSAIPDDLIMEAVSHAFMPEHVRGWVQRYNSDEAEVNARASDEIGAIMDSTQSH